jgi:hypothetical protein
VRSWVVGRPLLPFFFHLGTRIAFFTIPTDSGKSTGDVLFASTRDEPGAVTFTLVAGRVQVGAEFAFEA